MDTHKRVKLDIDAKLDSFARPSHTSEEGGSSTDIYKRRAKLDLDRGNPHVRRADRLWI